MVIFKAVTSVLVVILMIVILWFMRGVKDRASVVGFALMEIVYVMCLAGMWYGQQ